MSRERERAFGRTDAEIARLELDGSATAAAELELGGWRFEPRSRGLVPARRGRDLLDVEVDDGRDLARLVQAKLDGRRVCLLKRVPLLASDCQRCDRGEL